ncbi:ABC-type transport system involved in multi-copper enzyme maturation permease subunit [Gracilibacillus halotolerans]|uniref:ABC-type transport system involved in multi-copper enzyme maturation permease subunit n=1 Tax=Gracilibacillus halotolerans TaxID=74386 RepID=A0A841RPW5_9BACI|nr:hypothetical protein [Gracilibacillus halotolerans]MBB6513663.1 ABC-type transport system involved in multi-copper enzyme maturation permease subunit [Gracilibacillus halotolerans]
MSYFKLLFKKTLKTPTNIYLIVFLIIGIVGLYLLNLQASNFYSYMGQVKAHNQSILEIEEYYENILADNMEYSAEDTQNFKEGLQDTLQQKEWNKYILHFAEQEHWSEALTYSLKIIDGHLDVHEKNGGDLFPEDHVLALEREYLLFEQLASLNTEPDMEGYERLGFNYVFRVMDSLFPTLFVLIVTVFITETFVNSYKNGLNIPLLLPNSYKKTIFIKIVFSVLASTLIYVMSLLVSFGLASMISGTGHFQYPVILYSSDLFSTAPIWLILFKTFFLHTLGILNVVLMISLISFLVKNRMITLLITIILIIGSSMVVRSLDMLHSILHLNPFTYFSGADVVTNLLAYETGNSNISFLNGVISLSVLAVILLAVVLLTTRYEEKRQMLARN